MRPGDDRTGDRGSTPKSPANTRLSRKRPDTSGHPSRGPAPGR